MARKKKEKKRMSPKEMRSFTSSKLNTVRLLLENQKPNEAMVYMFHILSWLIENKFDVKKPDSMTIKEFFNDLVKSSKVPPDNIHPYVKIIEETLYSHHELPPDLLEQYKGLWGNLYRDIVGDMAPSF